jgi:D-beta-D-heptose 7-phosphate kinase/D-beta-D-heptose 1-phosphate adenosyltransferase
MDEATLIPYIRQFAGRRVGVLGDLMLDRYIWGSASRISQEAPVPVVQVTRESATPGGAANVVRNLLTLGARALAFGVTGTDRHGETLRSLLTAEGADLSGVLTVMDRETTVKTRVIAGGQQVVRIDRELTAALPGRCRDELLGRVCAAVESGSIEALILEDYAKGVLDQELVGEVVAVCARRGVWVALDPHPAHPFNVRGLRLMTPNRAEAFALAGLHYQPTVLPLGDDAALAALGRRLAELWAPELLLVTLGGHGMGLFAPPAPLLHIPTWARQVFDVSGAGDTVMAVFVLGLLAGANAGAAARLSNHAAGIVVAKVGTAAVTPTELEAALRDGAAHVGASLPVEGA